MAITGNTEEIRRKTALFFTNLYKRDASFEKNEYKLFHITPLDSLVDIRFKAEYAKDCVLIAFEPDKRHLNYLVNNLYRTNTVEEEHPIRSLCLITTDNLDAIKADNIIKIHLDDDFNLNKITEFFKPEKLYQDNKNDTLIKNIYYYINQLIHELMNKHEVINESFKNYQLNFSQICSELALSETAYTSSLLLNFAVEMYRKYCPNCNEPQVFNSIRNTIIQTVKNSFPMKGETTDVDFDNAKKICLDIDAYFGSAKRKKKIVQLGLDKVPRDYMLWYNEDYFYISTVNITDILDVQHCKLKLSLAERKALYQKGIIKVTHKKDGNIEYTTKYQKPLYKGDKPDGTRYIAFNRGKCREYNLFKNIEKYCIVTKSVDEITDGTTITPAEDTPISLLIPVTMLKGSHHLDLNNSNAELVFDTNNTEDNVHK